MLAAEEKAAVAQRYQAVGLEALLPRSGFVALLANEMQEADAYALAADALQNVYHLPEGWETLFTK